MKRLLWRALAWLLATGLPLQGQAITAARLAGPAHVHLAVSAAQADEHARVAAQHAAHHGHGHHADHEHGAVGHHHHDSDAGLVYLDVEHPSDAEAAPPGAGKRVVLDHDGAPQLLPPALPAPRSPQCSPRACPAFASLAAEPLERPPR